MACLGGVDYLAPPGVGHPGVPRGPSGVRGSVAVLVVASCHHGRAGPLDLPVPSASKAQTSSDRVVAWLRQGQPSPLAKEDPYPSRPRAGQRASCGCWAPYRSAGPEMAACSV